MNQNPEQLARDKIDADLIRCGWAMQDKSKINLVADICLTIRVRPQLYWQKVFFIDPNWDDPKLCRTKSILKNLLVNHENTSYR